MDKDYREKFERVLSALKDYVEDDLDTKVSSYVLEKLQKSLTDEELEEFGFGYLLEDGSDDSAEDDDNDRWDESNDSEDYDDSEEQMADEDDEAIDMANADDEDDASYWEAALMM